MATALRACAAMAAAFCLGATLASAYRQDWTIDEPDHLAYSRRLWDITRLPTWGWLCLLLASVWLTARRLWGDGAAHLALMLCALEPNLIAHGSLATVDVAYALATLWVSSRPTRSAGVPPPRDACGWAGPSVMPSR